MRRNSAYRCAASVARLYSANMMQTKPRPGQRSTRAAARSMLSLVRNAPRVPRMDIPPESCFGDGRSARTNAELVPARSKISGHTGRPISRGRPGYQPTALFVAQPPTSPGPLASRRRAERDRAPSEVAPRPRSAVARAFSTRFGSAPSQVSPPHRIHQGARLEAENDRPSGGADPRAGPSALPFGAASKRNTENAWIGNGLGCAGLSAVARGIRPSGSSAASAMRGRPATKTDRGRVG